MSILTEPLCITLQNTISKLGPIPDEYDTIIKSVLYSDDLPAQIALGCTLDKCVRDNSYQIHLKNFMRDLEERK